jgi:holliday junction DNA helicase RuvA
MKLVCHHGIIKYKEIAMYSTIKGIVTEIEPASITIENHGIGYEIKSPNPYAYKKGEDVKVFVFHYVKEDINALYGFMTLEAKHMFMKLINVSGIGPKSAMSILATNQIDQLKVAIEHADVNYLKKFPGIGAKSAQQIILDLKGKLELSPQTLTPKTKDVEDALLALGYSKTEITKLMPKLNHEMDIESMIKEALKMMLR